MVASISPSKTAITLPSAAATVSHVPVALLPRPDGAVRVRAAPPTDVGLAIAFDAVVAVALAVDPKLHVELRRQKADAIAALRVLIPVFLLQTLGRDGTRFVLDAIHTAANVA